MYSAAACASCTVTDVKVNLNFQSGRRQNYWQLSFLHSFDGNFGGQHFQLGRGACGTDIVVMSKI